MTAQIVATDRTVNQCESPLSVNGWQCKASSSTLSFSGGVLAILGIGLTERQAQLRKWRLQKHPSSGLLRSF